MEYSTLILIIFTLLIVIIWMKRKRDEKVIKSKVITILVHKYDLRRAQAKSFTDSNRLVVLELKQDGNSPEEIAEEICKMYKRHKKRLFEWHPFKY